MLVCYNNDTLPMEFAMSLAFGDAVDDADQWPRAGDNRDQVRALGHVGGNKRVGCGREIAKWPGVKGFSLDRLFPFFLFSIFYFDFKFEFQFTSLS